jgi:hypothetical protein
MNFGIKEKLNSVNEKYIQPAGQFYKTNIHPTVKIVAEKIIQIAKILLLVAVTCTLYYAAPGFAFYSFALGIVAPSVVFAARNNFMEFWNGKVWTDSSKKTENDANDTKEKTRNFWMVNRAIIVVGLGFGYLLNLAPATTCLTIFWFATLGADLHRGSEQPVKV